MTLPRLLPFRIVLGLSVLASGCGRNVPAPHDAADALANTEPNWVEQVRAVREGHSTVIRVTTPVTAAQWSELATGCERVSAIDVERLDAPDSALSQLAGLPRLGRVRIGSPVGDEGLAAIAQAGSLTVLNLPGGRFTDAGLAHLTPLPRLELLRFHSPHVTDEGMKHIARMPALRFLHLIDVPITDAGLEPLSSLDRLESFYLDGGQCTDDGLSRLLQKLPELHFHLNQLHLPDDPHQHPH